MSESIKKMQNIFFYSGFVKYSVDNFFCQNV